MVAIEFTFDTRFGQYNDALILPDDHGLTEQQIEALKVQRLTNWLKHFEPPPSEP